MGSGCLTVLCCGGFFFNALGQVVCTRTRKLFDGAFILYWRISDLFYARFYGWVIISYHPVYHFACLLLYYLTRSKGTRWDSDEYCRSRLYSFDCWNGLVFFFSYLMQSLRMISLSRHF